MVYYLILLSATIIIEAPLLGELTKTKLFDKRIIFINLLTHPLATVALWYFDLNIFLIELLVIISEAALIYFLYHLTYKKALSFSAIINIFSAFFGFIYILISQSLL